MTKIVVAVNVITATKQMKNRRKNNMIIDCKVAVHNVNEGYGEPYIVARLDGGFFWYWGRYETRERAESVAKDIDGLVLEVIE